MPKAHRETPFDMTDDEWVSTRRLLRQLRDEVEATVAPEGWNVGWNVGGVGGQTVGHAHCHLVPRVEDELYAGRGIRWWFKQPENRRPT